MNIRFFQVLFACKLAAQLALTLAPLTTAPAVVIPLVGGSISLLLPLPTARAKLRFLLATRQKCKTSIAQHITLVTY